MRQTQLFTKTTKNSPKDEVSNNAVLLIRAGYVYKDMAGVYSYLPLGLRVVEKIKNVIRAELNNAGCQEIVMTALQPQKRWEATDRWSDQAVDVWFRTTLKNDAELGLAFTHEEAITEIMTQYITSYKDLPCAAYQFQTKFRNELRSKSGIMRGREFEMKDLYSFSRSKEEHDKFYEKMKEVYTTIFNKIGIGDKTFLTMSSGEPFSKYSFEFQTLTDAGEDTLLYDKKKGIAINKPDYSDQMLVDFGFNKDDFMFEEAIASEVGDIYTLGTKYSEALGLYFTDEDGSKKPVFMGSYGIGISRVMGTVVEVFHDKDGMMWPEAIAPYKVHLISLAKTSEEIAKADKVYEGLLAEGVEVLYDDRLDTHAGEKFADADLIGLPIQVIISSKTLGQDAAEIRPRNDKTLVELVPLQEVIKRLT